MIADEVVDALEDGGLQKRIIKRTDTCDVPEPNGNGPKPAVDTVQAFLSYSLFQVCQTSEAISYIERDIYITTPPKLTDGLRSNNRPMRRLPLDMSDHMSTSRLHPTPTATWV